MNQNSNIHVEYLCGQPSWKFSRKNDAEYCKVCMHSIHDLKDKTPDEIDRLLLPGTTICGSFYKDQFVTDERTQHSPATFRLVLAALITWFSATKLGAQVQSPQVPTEQHYLGSDSSATAQDSAAIASEKIMHQPVCPPQVDPIVVNSKKMYHQIGNSRWYFTRSFPFVIKKRRFKGRISRGPRF
ncbi:MAG: hypothetical protein JWO09_3646 [Bacteroidetes bacterium]|nr:hypothetical protein [Bacteroidota bacterium]